MEEFDGWERSENIRKLIKNRIKLRKENIKNKKM